jgi:hypothetical protein
MTTCSSTSPGSSSPLCRRTGIWGFDNTWGRMLTYRGLSDDERRWA